MKGPSDLLEYLYELDFTNVDVSQIGKALAQFLIALIFIYVTQFAYERFQIYFLYVSIPLVVTIGYFLYAGFRSLGNAFRKKDKEYLVYVEGDQLKRKEIT